jgi:hypothetical protein
MHGRHSSMDRHSLTASGGCRCGWEGQPEAFHWFPQLSTPMLCLPANNPLRPPPPSHHPRHIATTTMSQ